jgi:hypothetical protein
LHLCFTFWDVSKGILGMGTDSDYRSSCVMHRLLNISYTTQKNEKNNYENNNNHDDDDDNDTLSRIARTRRWKLREWEKKCKAFVSVCVLNKLSVRADTQIDEKCREWKKAYSRARQEKRLGNFGWKQSMFVGQAGNKLKSLKVSTVIGVHFNFAVLKKED